MMMSTRSEQAAGKGQKGGGCQLDCTPDTKTTPLHRKCFLGPGSVIFAEVDVNSNFMTNYRLQQLVMHWLEEAE